MEHLIPVKYQGVIIGHTLNRPTADGTLVIDDIDPDVWNKIVSNNPDKIYISSRKKGTIDATGYVINEEQLSYDIELKTVDTLTDEEDINSNGTAILIFICALIMSGVLGVIYLLVK